MTFARSNRRAFTLIEIMVTIVIFSMVIAAIYAAWALIMHSTLVAQDVAKSAQRQRVTLRTLEDSLMAVQSFQASPQYYSFVVENGEESGDGPLLSFTAQVPDIFPRNGKFFNPNTGRDFNLRRLTYTLEPGADGQKNLVLRQNPVLMDMDQDEQKYPLVLAKNIKAFSIEWWDTNNLEWSKKDWLDTNSIPTLLRVDLVFGGKTSAGASAPDLAVARVFSLPSEMMPAAVQNGAMGGPPGLPQIPPPQIRQ
jgi:prepilin-type N-terminal cleavage/methylation domain-containing protein